MTTWEALWIPVDADFSAALIRRALKTRPIDRLRAVEIAEDAQPDIVACDFRASNWGGYIEAQDIPPEPFSIDRFVETRIFESESW